MKKQLFLAYIEKRYPKRLAKIYHDYVGLMHGKIPNDINKILLCLDFDHFVLPSVKEFKPDIIITHHPFIYGKKKGVLKSDSQKANLCRELDNLHIPIFSMHTNYDAGKNGMNDALANALDLHNVYTPNDTKLMRIGYLDHNMSIEDFVNYTKDRLKIDYCLLLNYGSKNIHKVGIVGGGASSLWKIAQKEGCDIYLSGDAPHHTRRAIVNSHFNYLDIPHEVEKIFMESFKKELLEIDPTFDILVVDHEKYAKSC